MLRLRYSGLAVIAMLGCSPVKDTSNVPDAPVDSTDMRAPMVESSNPADMATKVSVLQPISVFVDEQLDPATVNAKTVKVTFNQNMPMVYFPFFDILKTHGAITSGPTPIRGTVTYDAAARKISFQPLAPLAYGTLYTINLDAKDKAGLSLMKQLTFMTYVNGVTKQFFFNGTTGVPTQWFGTPNDMNGRNVKRLTGSSPGTDAQWFSADDPPNSEYSFAYTADGRITEERQNAQGPDGLYNTPDDITNQCITYKYDANKLNTERTYAASAGPDAMFCTADDVPSNNSLYTYMGNTMTGWAYYNHPGTDNIWRTSDDRCIYYWDYEYDAATGLKKRDVLRQCGPDNLPRTADDATLFAYIFDYEYDANGALTKSDWRYGAGPDGMWNTPDDQHNQVIRNQVDANGLVTNSLNTYAPGPDNIFGTDDDPGTRTTTTYNMQKLPDEVTTYNLGPDNQWNTADDVITSYSKFTYDAAGNRLDQKTYGTGIDGVFKTPDDRVSSDYDYDVGR